MTREQVIQKRKNRSKKRQLKRQLKTQMKEISTTEGIGKFNNLNTDFVSYAIQKTIDEINRGEIDENRLQTINTITALKEKLNPLLKNKIYKSNKVQILYNNFEMGK